MAFGRRKRSRPYLQSYSYDSLDRITSSAAGTYTYGDPNHPHAVTSLSDIPNQYASYDAMGNMSLPQHRHHQRTHLLRLQSQRGDHDL